MSRKPEIIVLDPPLICYGVPRRHILSEESFVEFMLDRAMTRDQLRFDYNISNHVYNTSLSFYKDKYEDRILKLKHTRYSNALKGNTHGKKSQPDVLLDKETLSLKVDSGKKASVIAKEMNTTEWYVRENIKFYGLSKTKELPYRMQHTDLEYLDRLETFTPGIKDAAQHFYEDPHKFFLLLYDCFLRVSELLWFIKDQAKSHEYHVAKGLIPKDHICWNSNKREMRFSKALLAEGIQHVRQFNLAKRFSSDFVFHAKKLIVELDGPFHEIDAVTKKRDADKELAGSLLGYTTLRFKNDKIDKEMPWVINIMKNFKSEK